MAAPSVSLRLLRFGSFEVDLRAGELRKNGIKLKLQEQPFQILSLLLEHGGEIATREELRAKLWPADTFVDFDHSLNAAIKRLRDVLGDDAENPRFIETVSRKGYRFIAPVTGPSVLAVPRTGRGVHFTRWQLICFGIVITMLVVATSWSFWPQRRPEVKHSKRLSFGGRAVAPFPVFGEVFPAITTDGSRIYFSIIQDATLKVAYLSTAGGDQIGMSLPLENAEIRHISPDGSELLVYASIRGETERHLWVVPTAGGGPRRLTIDGHDGAWAPNGQRLIYARAHDLYVAEYSGNNSRKLATLAGKAFWLRWSPDAARVRFTVIDPTSSAKSLWECRSDGSNLHRLSISWERQPEECCGEWSPDGKHFYFRTFLDSHAEIWEIGELRFPHRTYSAVRLTSGPIDFASVVPSHNGNQLLTVGVEPKWEVLTYSPRTRSARAWISGLSAFAPSTSRDGRWVAYVEGRGKESILWRSKPDGSERLQLSEPPLFVGSTRWSPDGSQLAFMGKMPDKPWNVYIVSARGGVPRALLNDARNAVDPEWSADGRRLAFGRPPEQWAEAGMPKAIYVLDLATNETSKLPGSDGLYSPRWSPDGRYVAALPLDDGKLVLFDFATRTWKNLTSFPHISNPQWSQDSRYLYVDGFNNELVRIRSIDGKVEKLLDLKTVDPNALFCDFANVASGGDVLLVCPLARADIFALDVGVR